MITSDQIRSRLELADAEPKAAIMSRYTARLLAALRELPEEDPRRLPDAIEQAVTELWRSAYKAGCMGCVGLTIDGEEDGE